MGLIARTAEMGNPDPSDNWDHYYLSDAMGGSVGLYVDGDGDSKYLEESKDNQRQATRYQELP